MQLNYIIIEDNPGAVQNLRAELSKFKELQEVGTAGNSASAVAMAIEKMRHIIFLDVELEKEKNDGFEVMRQIRENTGSSACIIMTTGFVRYAKQAVNQDVLYFLDKPIDPDELSRAIQKAQTYFSRQKNFIAIKNSDGHFLLEPKDIQYLSAKNNYCTIFRNQYPPLTVSRTLKDIERLLPDDFIRIHNSYVVNRQFIHKVNTTKKIVEIAVEEKSERRFLPLPIGKRYMAVIRSILLRE